MFHIFLSDFSPQDDSIQTAVTPCCQQTSIPLLMACTANVKTVVANPIVYLTNLTHDILQTINALDSPPHPDVVNNEVKHSLLSTSVSGTVYCINWHFLVIERLYMSVYWRRTMILGNMCDKWCSKIKVSFTLWNTFLVPGCVYMWANRYYLLQVCPYHHIY